MDDLVASFTGGVDKPKPKPKPESGPPPAKQKSGGIDLLSLVAEEEEAVESEGPSIDFGAAKATIDDDDDDDMASLLGRVT